MRMKRGTVWSGWRFGACRTPKGTIVPHSTRVARSGEHLEPALLAPLLHTLTAQDLALPDTIGLQPGGIMVTASRLVLSFVRKQAAQPD